MTRERRRDEGMTLVELVVAMAVGTLVLLVAGGFFISMIGKQARMTDAGLSTAQVQNGFTGLETAVRNAARVQIVSRHTTGDLLIASTGGSGGEPNRCEAWFYIPGSGPSSGKLYRRSVSEPATPTGIASVTASNLSGWMLVVDRADALLLADGLARPTFAQLADGAVVIALQASASAVGGGESVVRVETTLAPLTQNFTANPNCFS